MNGAVHGHLSDYDGCRCKSNPMVVSYHLINAVLDYKNIRIIRTFSLLYIIYSSELRCEPIPKVGHIHAALSLYDGPRPAGSCILKSSAARRANL